MNLTGAITFLPTCDLGDTREFYQNALGLELALDQGSCLIFRVVGGGFWGFCQSTIDLASPERTILTLVTNDVDGWHTSLVERGVAVDAPPRVNPQYQIYHFFAADPNGYRIEVQRFLDERWA